MRALEEGLRRNAKVRGARFCLHARERITGPELRGSRVADFEEFDSVFLPAYDPHAGASDPKVRSNRGDERVVGLTIMGRGSDPHVESSRAGLFNVGAASTCSDSDRESHASGDFERGML